ncbi:MAG: carbohydrate kinase family protein [Deltaproteobacteria bacterium]|nr:carbohydrate kinase family protein [Deltaproteobacteria bacterium]
MNRFDMVFIGQMGVSRIFPFEGSPFIEEGSPLLFAAAAASSLGKRIAAVTRITADKEYLLEPLKNARVDLFVQPGELYEYEVLFPTQNVDQRKILRMQVGKPFMIGDLPPVEPCLIHLCCIGVRGFHLDLARALKARGFRLSVDMQIFMRQADPVTGLGDSRLEDFPEKREIVSIADFVKLDAVEGRMLTGLDAPEDQAETLEGWGSRETIITCSAGVFARSEGKTGFAEFTNRSGPGRMGRGDTVMGSYLARRLNHSVQDALRFAAALTSIKLESQGPFRGTLEDVVRRMGHAPLE